MDKDDVQLYADSAYRSQDIERYLQGIKCKSQVHEKGVRGNPLSEQQKANNRKKSKQGNLPRLITSQMNLKIAYVRLFKLPAKRNYQAILAIKNTVSTPKTILIILTIAMATTKRH